MIITVYDCHMTIEKKKKTVSVGHPAVLSVPSAPGLSPDPMTQSIQSETTVFDMMTQEMDGVMGWTVDMSAPDIVFKARASQRRTLIG